MVQKMPAADNAAVDKAVENRRIIHVYGLRKKRRWFYVPKMGRSPGQETAQSLTDVAYK